MKRSKFNLSHTRLLTCDMGQLIPIGLTEVLPGDTVQHAVSLLVRAMPLVAPPMHRVRMKVHSWYVPHRLVWDDWENFITGGPDGLNTATVPTILATSVSAEKSLGDYLGVPPGMTQGAVSALPFRAYAKIFNECYRDQDLVSPVALSTLSYPGTTDTVTNTTLLNSAWEKDYFTVARPWEQKGAAVTLPLGTSAPVYGDGKALGVSFGGADYGMVGTAASGLSATTGNYNQNIGTANSGTNLATAQGMGVVGPGKVSGLYADLTNATAVDINDVRQAFALQRYKEARARYGSRYTEYLAYLGVRSSDSRLQRPEYLGGGTNNISFSEVLQTASTTADANGVGQLYGHGIGAMRSNRYRKFFEEHGYIVTLLHVLPETMYPQGLRRTWNRRVKEDFWQRELEHIGQQAIQLKEVYALGTNGISTFGYADRYDEYRRAESSVHGEFRTTLNDWHFARLLAAEPTLNGTFVTSNPTKRCFQSQSTNTLLVQARHRMAARRMLSASGSSYIF